MGVVDNMGHANPLSGPHYLIFPVSALIIHKHHLLVL
jgi:hypothetical protein